MELFKTYYNNFSFESNISDMSFHQELKLIGDNQKSKTKKPKKDI